MPKLDIEALPIDRTVEILRKHKVLSTPAAP